MTVSDYDSITKLDNVYHVAEDEKVAGIMALKAGMDTEAPISLCYDKGLIETINEGISLT